jgi:4'-phosphopantetheinyl transferase
MVKLFAIPESAASIGEQSEPVRGPLEISWPIPAADFAFRLKAASAHVWAFPLELEAGTLEVLATLLPSAEHDRASRFYFQRDRARFIAGRAQLRILLARYLRADPAALTFAYGPFGKPALTTSWATSKLAFNVAHSEDLAVAAFARTDCGIDVERVRPLADMDELVSRFFSPRETVSFLGLPAGEKPQAFFNLWTRKEAWLKAIGEGIGHSLDRVEVSFLPGEPAKLVSLPGNSKLAASWSLLALAPAAGFTAALARPGPQGPVAMYRMHDPSNWI